MMSNKNTTGRNLSTAITSEDILGKRVIDAEGRYIGVSEKVLIDPENLTLIGISIDKGALYRSVVIGKGYVKQVTPHAILLKVPVVFEIKGMTVFDKSGRNLGIVKDITLHHLRNKIKELHVKTSFFSSLLTIPADAIEVIGTNVILKITQEEISEKNKK